MVAHVIPWRCCSPHTRHGQRPRAPLRSPPPMIHPSSADGQTGVRASLLACRVRGGREGPALCRRLPGHLTCRSSSENTIQLLLPPRQLLLLSPAKPGQALFLYAWPGQNTDPDGWKLLPSRLSVYLSRAQNSKMQSNNQTETGIRSPANKSVRLYRHCFMACAGVFVYHVFDV